MKVTEDCSPLNDGKIIMIEWTGLELVKHVESRFERMAREVYEQTKTVSDMLFYLSEYAKTEENVLTLPDRTGE